MSPYIKNFQNSSEFSERKFWRFFRFLANNLPLVVLISSIIVFAFIYLVQISLLSESGYVMRDMEERLEELKARNSELSVKISAIKARQKVEGFMNEFEMVEVKGTDGIGYVRLTGRQTAFADKNRK